MKTHQVDLDEKTLRLIGHVGVDSGQVMITDPCYLSDWKNDEFDSSDAPLNYSYSGACAATLGENGGAEIGSGTQGVASRTAHGDGCFPVFQIIGDDGTVEGLFVDFAGMTDPEDDALTDEDEGY
jgi:hypothetical protein